MYGVCWLVLGFSGFGCFGVLGFLSFFFSMSKTCICALVPNCLIEKNNILKSTVVLVWEEHLGRKLPIAVLHPLQLY